MDWIIQKKDILTLFKKYRYTTVAVLLGILLMMLPKQIKPDEAIIQMETSEDTVDFQSELEDILSQIAGAGNVKVLLSELSGEETVYQTDTHSGSNDVRKDTVLITNSDRDECGLIVRTNPPIYQGAVVLCQGADKAAIRLSIVEAVMSATGLTSDCISVLKMK